MEFHRGRLLDHVHLRVRDLERSRRFYEGALGSLGLGLQGGEDFFWSDELFVSADGDADLTMLSRLSRALARARAVPLAA